MNRMIKVGFEAGVVSDPVDGTVMVVVDLVVVTVYQYYSSS